MFRQSLIVFLLLLSCGAATAFAQQSENRSELELPFIYGEESSYLGVQTEEVTKENFSKFGLSKVQGVLIDKVLKNSPAALAGLQKGDVILKFDGEEVSSARKLMRLIGEVAPDHQATLVVWRGGSEREIVATLSARPSIPLENGVFVRGIPVPMSGPILVPNGSIRTIPRMSGLPRIRELPPYSDDDRQIFVWRSGGRQIGVVAAPLTKQLAEYFGVADGKGLLISSVLKNSPAERAGLKAGDVIVEAEDQEIKTEVDLIRALNEKKEGDVALTIIRDKTRQTVRVTPDAAKEEPK